jgi:sugar lactone lactonase YvrE
MVKRFMTALADPGDLCGECPVWMPDSQEIYWTDCVGLKFHCHNWRTGQYRSVAQGVEVYGFRPNSAGGFVVTNTSGVWLWDGENPLRLVADQVEGSRLQVNDCCADRRGRLLTTSFYYDPAGRYPLGRLVRIDNSGRVDVLDEGFHLGNGIGLSPDERTLYVTDTVARKIYAFDYGDTLSGRRIFVEVPATEGIPDGLAVDALGHVWSAQWYGSCVVRYDPDGRVERRIDVPAKQTSSVAFGGPDLMDVFITSAAQSEKLPVMPRGYDPSSGVIGGALYHTNLEIPGQPQFRAAIRPPE